MTDIEIPVNFRPKARLIHLLGENLLKDEVTAILELVKNSHDVDATILYVASRTRNTLSESTISFTKTSKRFSYRMYS